MYFLPSLAFAAVLLLLLAYREGELETISPLVAGMIAASLLSDWTLLLLLVLVLVCIYSAFLVSYAFLRIVALKA